MGVQGLWSLIKPAGKPITLESLEGRVLAIDASLWLHHLGKGVRDRDGELLPNAHLIGLFRRVCKLMFAQVKPVFVFDGPPPEIKKRVLSKRSKKRKDAHLAADRAVEKRLSLLLRSHAVSAVLGKSENASPVKKETLQSELGCMSQIGPHGPRIREETAVNNYNTAALYRLPAVPESEVIRIKESARGDVWEQQRGLQATLEDILEENPDVDVQSSDFRSLPVELQHELLREMHEREKFSVRRTPGALSGFKAKDMNEAADFSGGQLARLVKRSKLTKRIVESRKQMSEESTGRAIGDWLDAATHSLAQRIASEDGAHSLFITGLKHTTHGTEDGPTSPKMSRIDEEACRALLDADEREEKRKADCVERQKLPAQQQLDEWSASDSESPQKINNEICTNDIRVLNDKKVFRPRLKVSNNVSEASDSDESPCVEEDLCARPSPPAENVSKDNETTQVSDLTQRKSEDYDNMPTFFNRETSVSQTVDSLPSCSALTPLIVTAEHSSQKVLPSMSVDYLESGLAELPQPREISGSTSQQKDAEETLAPAREEEHTPAQLQETRQSQSDDDEGFEEVAIPAAVKDSVVKEVELFKDVSLLKELPETQTGAAKATAEDVLTEQETNDIARQFAEINEVGLEQYQQQIELERQALREEQMSLQRAALTLSDQMVEEAKELLQLFGVPFVCAPSEAEAQCAWLEACGLTDGCVTDDSDVWLFGAKLVYKNVFNQDQHVELYRSTDLHSMLDLDRERLIQLAYLCGSDYALGVTGVGAVTALEIMSEFSGDGLDGLKQLSEWWEEECGRVAVGGESKLKAKLRRLQLPPDLTDPAARDAYLHPEVDMSGERFSWAAPDLDLLRQFAEQKFGWGRQQTDEALLPAIRKFRETSRQQSIKKYFTTEINAPQRPLGKRVQNALALKRRGKALDQDNPDRNEHKVDAAKKENGVQKNGRL